MEGTRASSGVARVRFEAEASVTRKNLTEPSCELLILETLLGTHLENVFPAREPGRENGPDNARRGLEAWERVMKRTWLAAAPELGPPYSLLQVLLAKCGFGLGKRFAERGLGCGPSAKSMKDNPLTFVVPLPIFDYPCASEF